MMSAEARENAKKIVNSLREWAPRDYTVDLYSNGFVINYRNRSSVGNRYINTASVIWYPNGVPEGKATISAAEASKLAASYGFGWQGWVRVLDLMYSGVITGPETVRVVEEFDTAGEFEVTSEFLGKLMRSVTKDAVAGELYSEDHDFGSSYQQGWNRSC
jgi:hypothetical protein